MFSQPSQNIKSVRTKEPNESSPKVKKPKAAAAAAAATTTKDARKQSKPMVTQGSTTSTDKQRILCAISSLGYCVVYRNNGSARFICTEFGGCLCNRSGSVSYQWKWDELKLKDYEKFKNELITDVNSKLRITKLI